MEREGGREGREEEGRGRGGVREGARGEWEREGQDKGEK